MKIALVEPNTANRSLRAYTDHSEPTHLLGMYNLIKQKKGEIELIDAYSSNLSSMELINLIIDQKFTHIGFTVYDYEPIIKYVQRIFTHIPEDIITIVGGPGAKYSTKRIISFLNPDYLVKGQGENALMEIFENTINEDHISTINNTKILNIKSIIKIDNTPYQRPYKLSNYDYNASPLIQTGCIGKCIFCSGAYQKKFDYISYSSFAELIDYLVYEKKAKCISPCGPDFTARPYKANELIWLFLTKRFPINKFQLGVRLDTLSSAIKLDQKLWKSFTSLYSVNFESSIESFSYDRIERLGKNYSADFLKTLFNDVQVILDVCKSKIVLGRIALDPTLTLNEFLYDCKMYRKLLQEFPDRITIGGMIMNQFIPLSGTPSTETTKEKEKWEQKYFSDERMNNFHHNFLENGKFKLWCKLAEDIKNYSSRNNVIDEILKVSMNKAIEYAETV